MKWLRVIRDPYKRAVSSYRHAVQFPYMDALMSKHFGCSIDSKGEGFSFLEFLDYLSSNGPKGDVHNIPQMHPLEEFISKDSRYVINLDNTSLKEGLLSFEQWAEIHHADPPSLPIITPLGTSHAVKKYDTDEDLSSKRFSAAEASDTWPGYSSFLNDLTMPLIEQIYQVDFVEYRNWL